MCYSYPLSEHMWNSLCVEYSVKNEILVFSYCICRRVKILWNRLLSVVLCECDCHYGLNHVNAQNMVNAAWNFAVTVYLTCPVSAASACPVYSRLVAALTYIANIKSFRNLHLQS